MRPSFFTVVSLFSGLAVATPVRPPRTPRPPLPQPKDLEAWRGNEWVTNEVPRLVLYYQTTHDGLTGSPISMLPLITEKNIALTHLIVCSFHINANGTIHLNDYPPHFPLFSTMWQEVELLKLAGVKIMGMVGGAAAGSFGRDTLGGSDEVFEKYYSLLSQTIWMYGLQGMDLDVEEYMGLEHIRRLVHRLRAEFGPDFIITLAPVASALWGGGNLSGFDYQVLEKLDGRDVAFYNAQFYNGWGGLRSTADFDNLMERGWDSRKIVLGQVTTSKNGWGYVSPEVLNSTVVTLRSKHGEIGGVMGWEYFNSAPGGEARPWEWAQDMTRILRPNLVPTLKITRKKAEQLTRLYYESFLPGDHLSAIAAPPTVDYFAMVNA